MQGVEDAAFAFDRACRAAKVPYVFVGGLAVMVWGQPRATADVDAMVDLVPDSIGPLVEALRREGLEADARDFHDALHDRAHVTVDHHASGFHIHVKIVGSPEERNEIRTARVVALRANRIAVPEPEDVVRFKLLYGSPQDV